MSSRAETVAALEACGVVAVIRLKEAGTLRAVVDALAAGGVLALEVTMTVPRALELIAEIAPSLPPEIVLGAGTVLDAATARAAIEAGARYVVSPVFREEVLRVCHRAGVAAMPGCFTPTEILAASEAGADVVPTARRREHVEAAAAEVESFGRRSLRVTADVTDRSSLEAALAACVAELGRVDVLVNCAACTKRTGTSTSARRSGSGSSTRT